MAVSKMKKLSVVTMLDEADGLLYALQRLRCVELYTQTEDAGRNMESADDISLSAAIGQAEQGIAFLAGYRKKNRKLLSSPQETEWDETWPAGTELAESAAALEKQLHETRCALNEIRNRREGLLPWREYTGILPESRTKYTKTVCGLLPLPTDMDHLAEALEGYACVTEEIPQTMTANPEKARNHAMAVTMWTEDAEAIISVLHGYGFVPAADFTAAEDKSVQQILDELTERKAELEKRQNVLQDQAGKLAEKLPRLEEYLDRLTTLEARQMAAKRLGCTGHTAVLTGWVPENMTERVQEVLAERGDAWELADPAQEDDVPVLLRNPVSAASFEPVVALYSLPAYGTYDPTFLMSFFYILIFGLMFADVGYGLLLTAGCILGKYLLKPEGTLRKFLHMFTLCGISMMGMGFLFGGYLGDLPQVIAQNFGGKTENTDLALWFNPLNDPMKFLVLSLVVGAVHLFTGLAVQFVILWQKGDKVSAISDAGSWMLVFLGGGIGFFNLYAGLSAVGIGMLTLICTKGRHEKNPVMKILRGFMGLYGIVNYISDLLSYSRILSLGLASAVIASVFNIIGTMAGPTAAGIFLLILAGGIGHAMNLAINLLGAFVHTSRLQYIEFFGKFFEDGGRPFTPLTPRSRYVRFR